MRERTKGLSVGGGDHQTLFLAGAVAVAIGAILISHAFYAMRWGNSLNTAELGGGMVFAGFGLTLVFLGYKELTFVPETRATVRVSPAPLRAGQGARLDWSIVGDTARLQKLTIELQGEEMVIKRSGGERRATTTLFATLPVLEKQAPLERKGVAKFTVPADARPTMVSPDGNLSVDWVVHVVGMRLEDTFEDHFPVTVQST